MATRRWIVPRPGPDGTPLGVMTIEVVPAQAYDKLKATLDELVAASTPVVDEIIPDVWERLNDAHLAACELLAEAEAVASERTRPS